MDRYTRTTILTRNLFGPAAIEDGTKNRGEMETVREDEEYNSWDVKLPTPRTSVSDLDFNRGRDIVIAVDHGPKSKQALDWALIHFCRPADTVHLVNAVSSVTNQIVYDASQGLMEKLAAEASHVAKVKCVARIVDGDAGKAICKEADRIKPVAVVMGTRGRSLMQSVLQGSVSEYCFHHCKAAPVIIVPGKDA